MKIVQEFKEFAVKGNALDLAVGVIIGAAFGRIVTSMVEDIMMPPLGYVVGKIDFSNLFIALDGREYPSLNAAREAGAPIIGYGAFVNNIINFMIVAFAVFLLVRQINRVKKGEDAAPEAQQCPYCVQSISLKATRCPFCTSELETGTAANPSG